MSENMIIVSDEEIEQFHQDDVAEAQEEVAIVLHSNSERILEALADLREVEARLDNFRWAKEQL